MHRIDTATKAVDLFGAGKHGFRMGDKSLGVIATQIDADYINDLQESLIALLDAASIAPVKNSYGQILAALRAAGVFTTPAQFDNTTKAATTAFLRGEGLQSSNVFSIGATPFAVTNSHAGAILYATTGASVINLPDATTWPAGKALVIQAAVATTVNRFGSQTIFCNSAGQTSVALGDGDSITLYAVPMFSGWVSVGNSGQLGKSAAFGASLAASGYQKLPSGLIIQWGTVTTSASADVTVTFPISFPTACKSFVANAANSVTRSTVMCSGTMGLSSVPLGGFTSNTAARVAEIALWTAIGY